MDTDQCGFGFGDHDIAYTVMFGLSCWVNRNIRVGIVQPLDKLEVTRNKRERCHIELIET